MKTFTCDICNAPMKLETRLSNYKGITKEYRRRRFKCTICDYTKMIFADGMRDEEIFPELGIDEIKKNYKQEEKNRA